MKIVHIIILALFVFSGGLAAEELLKFTDHGLRLTGANRPGSENLRIEKTTAPDGIAALAMRWTPGAPGWIETALQKAARPLDFGKAEFTVHARIPEEANIKDVTLRFIDSTGEIFQYPTSFRPGKPGENRFRCLINTGKANKNSFGGNHDGKIDLPLRFRGVVCGIADPAKPGGILLHSLDYRMLDREHITVALTPEHPISLILPDMAGKPALLFRNHGAETAKLSGTLMVKDVDGKSVRQAVDFTVPVNEEHPLEIPLLGNAFGVRYLEYRLKSLPSGKEFTARKQFALMKPFEERGRKQTFLFGSAGPTGPTGSLAQRLTGVKNNRGNAGWTSFKPGVWDFTGIDRFVNNHAANGVQIQFVIGPPPEWAVAKDYRPHDPTLKKGWKRPDYELFREYVDRLSKRYRGKIPYYIVGNEPDLVRFCNYTEEEYMKMLEIAYTTIKKNDPNALVMSGGIASVGTQLPIGRNTKRYHNTILSRLLTEGKLYYDVFAFHGHGRTAAYLRQLKSLREMGAIGKDKPWISEETGIPSSVIGEKGQAIVLFQKLILAWAYGADGFDWYNFYDLGTDPLNKEQHFGILTHANEPKPAFLAYAAVTDLLFGGTYLSSPIEDEDVHAHLFQSAENSFILPYWSMSKKMHLLLFSGITGPASITDIFRNEKTVNIRGNSLLLKAEEMPYALIVKQGKAPIVSGSVFTGEPCYVVPGNAREFSFELRNPLERELTADLTFTPPPGVKGGGRRQLRVPAGKSAAVTIPLHPEKEFRSYSTDPANMSIALRLHDIGTEILDWEVISNIPITGKRTNAPTFTLDQQDQVTTYAISGPENHLFWQGTDDLSGKIWLYRNGESLILEVAVMDDIHSQKFRDTDLWQGDSVQFVFALPSQNKHWTFGLARLEDGTPNVWCWNAPRNYSSKKAAGEIKLKVNRDETSKITMYRAEIPFRTIGLTDAIGNRGFRFNLAINDNDGTKRESCIRLVEGIEHSGNPFNYLSVSFH